MKSKTWLDHLWMPFTSHNEMLDFPPLVIERGSGIYLYDTNGKQYIDATGSWWVSAFGHCNPQISEAVKNQLDKLEHVLMAGFISDTTAELTALLGELLPPQLNRIFYSDNGSTSVEVALKIALQYHAVRGDERCEFVALSGGYHGDTFGAMSVGGIPSFHGLFHERFKKQHFTDSPYCFRCPMKKNPQDCSAQCMDSLERILNEHGKRVAACVFEPMVQGAVGMRVYPPKVLHRIFELCKLHKVITIADEVATGLGRTGEMFACDHAGVVPDIMCLAKGLTGGYLPLAVTAVREEIYDEFKGGPFSNRTLNHGHTFTGNPLASAAAAAALKLLTKNQLPKSAQPVMRYFAKGVELLGEHKNIAGARHLGFVGAFEIVSDKKTNEAFQKELRVPFRFSQIALQKGLIVRPLGNTVYYMPPFNVTIEELDQIFALTKEAIEEVCDERAAS